jgi:hypothetical protein
MASLRLVWVASILEVAWVLLSVYIYVLWRLLVLSLVVCCAMVWQVYLIEFSCTTSCKDVRVAGYHKVVST